MIWDMLDAIANPHHYRACISQAGIELYLADNNEDDMLSDHIYDIAHNQEFTVEQRKEQIDIVVSEALRAVAGDDDDLPVTEIERSEALARRETVHAWADRTNVSLRDAGKLDLAVGMLAELRAKKGELLSQGDMLSLVIEMYGIEKHLHSHIADLEAVLSAPTATSGFPRTFRADMPLTATELPDGTLLLSPRA